MGKVKFQFSRSLLLVLTKFSFQVEDWALGYNSMKFFLKISLSRLATREAIRIYHVNHAFFHLWRKKKLVKHQKVSKHYDHDCRLVRVNSISWWINSSKPHSFVFWHYSTNKEKYYHKYIRPSDIFQNITIYTRAACKSFWGSHEQQLIMPKFKPC